MPSGRRACWSCRAAARPVGSTRGAIAPPPVQLEVVNPPLAPGSRSNWRCRRLAADGLLDPYGRPGWRAPAYTAEPAPGRHLMTGPGARHRWGRDRRPTSRGSWVVEDGRASIYDWPPSHPGAARAGRVG
jgi:hypothetical protein